MSTHRSGAGGLARTPLDVHGVPAVERKGEVTAVSTVSALAPVYTEVTDTVGGATSGYCAIGIAGIASAPASTITREQTVARMGRRMKVSTNIAASQLGLTGAPSPIFCRLETMTRSPGLSPLRTM